MSFKLSATLSGHTSDVRGLAAASNDTLVSVSRDKTAKVWRRIDGGPQFALDVELIGHQGYVNTVAAAPTTTEYPRGLVATAGSDKTILLWDLVSSPSEPVGRLAGHTENVCALAASSDGRTLVSGSWDRTARVWVDGKCTQTLNEHEHAVWCVLVLRDGSIVTGSADKLIRRWRDGRVVQTYKGHTDCVRALVELPDGSGFVSAGNDSELRVWTLEGVCQATLVGHTSFVYSLSALPGGYIVSGGEDRTVRVWELSSSRLVHTIVVPATSVWAVIGLANGDVACGTSSGEVHVFSLDTKRLASPEQLLAYESSNAKFSISKKTLGNVDFARLPGANRLENPGDYAQQMQLVQRDSATVEMYQWDGSEERWIKIGTVEDSQDAPRKKQVFEGKSYDHVFDVDIQEGAPALKLPYNVSENPYSAAQRFLERNNISLEHLDTVANFIIRNADSVGTSTGAAEQSYVDPFTGGSRYVPGQGSGAAAGGGSFGDPFTGGNRYVPTGGAGAGTQVASYVPPSEYVVNRQGNVAGILKKLAEFNAEAKASGDNYVISDADLEALSSLDWSGTKCSPAVCKALVESSTQWAREKRFPSLDLLRLAVAQFPDASLHLRQDAAKGLVDVVGEATGFFKLLSPSAGRSLDKADEINLMMGARVLGNAFVHAGDLVWEAHKQVLGVLEGSWWERVANKNLNVAFATLYLNLAIAASRRGVDDDGLGVLAAANQFLGSAAADSAEVQLRLLGVFGVLAKRFHLCKESARVLGDESIVILGYLGKSDAVKQTAKDLGGFLSAA
ncbi:hypothetical protein GGI07_001899 [Coemansia sp. Benny D115]|nr:hypothetical protein GGI07_001899 [Coemansia sp. Benny D115]